MPLLQPDLEMPVLSHALHGLEDRTAQAEHGAAVARAVGLQAGELLHLLERHLGGALHLHVDIQRRHRHIPAHVGADVLVHLFAEGGDVGLLDRKARGELVPAEPDKQIGAGLQRGKEIEAPVAAARALAHAAGEVDHEARTGEFFAQARGHDAHHALVPVLAGEHERIALARRQQLHLFDRAGEDLLLHALPLAVEVAQRARHLLGLRRIVGQQQLRSQLRLLHASGGIDARRQHEADLRGGDGLSGQTRLAQQRVQPDEVAAVNALEAAAHDRAVFPLHAHHVRHRADRGERAVARKDGLLALVEGEHQLERHAHAGKVLERVGAVRPVRIDHCRGVGQGLLALVMIRNDQIDAQRIGVGGFLHTGDAAVHGDDQRHAGFRERADRLAAQAVALLGAAGDVHDRVRAAGAQIVGQKAGGGDAVHIIIAVYRNLFAVGQRAGDALNGLVHILHQKRGVGQCALALERLGRLLGGRHAARGQHARHQIGIARIHQCPDRFDGRLGDIPSLIFHGRPKPPFFAASCRRILIQANILPNLMQKVKSGGRKKAEIPGKIDGAAGLWYNQTYGKDVA